MPYSETERVAMGVSRGFSGPAATAGWRVRRPAVPIKLLCLAELGQKPYIASLLVAETEILTYQNGFDTQIAD